MPRVFTKKDIEYLDSIGRRRLTTHTKYFRRNLHLNHKDLNIKILRIKNKQQFFEETKGFKEMNADVCFFLYHIYVDDLSNWLLKSRDKDIVITDSATNKIIDINQKNKNYPDFVNIWIVKSQIPTIYEFKIGDILFTR